MDNKLKSFVLQVRLEQGEKLSDKELTFVALNPQREYSEPFLQIKKHKEVV